MLPPVPYTYQATVVRVIDGDTVVLDVDLGFGVWMRAQSYRLVGCNAIEKNQPGGQEAKANLTGLLPAGVRLVLSTVKDDKYGGRYDAHLNVDGVGDLVAHLIVEGWAAPWNGAGRRPVPAWPRPGQKT